VFWWRWEIANRSLRPFDKLRAGTSDCARAFGRAVAALRLALDAGLKAPLYLKGKSNGADAEEGADKVLHG
jgi:hypothetical protein